MAAVLTQRQIGIEIVDIRLSGRIIGSQQPMARRSGAEIISDISHMPFMGAAELRYGPFGIFADGLHIPLGVPITTRNIFFSGGSSAVTLNVATGDFLYRLFERPGQAIDGGLGSRWWGASADTTLVGRGPVPTQSVSVSGSWADPLIAARYHIDFSKGLGLTAYGDVGGFGIAAH